MELGSRQVRVSVAEGGSARALLRAIRDVHGNEIRLEYEGDRLVRIVDTAERELKVRWKDGRITRLELWAERRLGQWVDYRYDRAGCLIAAVDAVGGVQEETFDGRTLRYGYRSSGRLGRIEQAADGTWRDLFYDREGNLTADETPDGAIGHARDRMGRLLGAVLEESSGQRIETWFERDRFGRVVCERQGDMAVRFGYDARGRRVSSG
ncbi:hypothetical protein [Sorangium sp. So ce381]|uniref:hypothetical protein n=1 Tax=Sorangium sp. So ce381 TaxID=3133307 RepID=UPI003F5B4D8E